MQTPPPDLPDLLAMATSAKRRRRLGCLAGGFGLVVSVPLLIAFVAILVAIWPGSLQWTARFVCPLDFDASFIVRDTYRPRPGETVTTFTMYCMNARGEVHDAGILRSVAYLFAALLGLLVVIVAIGALVALVRRSRRSVPLS